MPSIERIVFACALALLAFATWTMGLSFPSSTALKQEIDSKLPGVPLHTFSASQAHDMVEQWGNPPCWEAPPNSHRLFLSNTYLMRPNGDIFPVQDASTAIDGIPIQWAYRHGLDLTSPTLALDDPDNDGFFNRLEYENQTNPTSSQSHPPFLSRLRVARLKQEPFRIIFRSHYELNGQPILQIHLLDAPGQPTQLLRVGESIPHYQITDFRAKQQPLLNQTTHIMEEKDLSEIDLTRSDIGKIFTLIRGKEANLPQIEAEFILLLPHTFTRLIPVAQGKTFSLPQQPEQIYQFLTAEKKGVWIYAVGNDKKIFIPLVQDQELAEMPESISPSQKS